MGLAAGLPGQTFAGVSHAAPALLLAACLALRYAVHNRVRLSHACRRPVTDWRCTRFVCSSKRLDRSLTLLIQRSTRLKWPVTPFERSGTPLARTSLLLERRATPLYRNVTPHNGGVSRSRRQCGM